MHLLALVLHIANGWLVGLLARRMLPDRPGFHLLAAALYLTFPFSYPAVPWVSSLGHLSAVMPPRRADFPGSLAAGSPLAGLCRRCLPSRSQSSRTRPQWSARR
jgi:hypothetical protein